MPAAMASQASPRLAMVAGEASGDLIAGLMMGGLRQRWPELKAQGIGGPGMAAQGFEAWWPHEKLAVRGFAEVLMHYREISGIRDQLAERLLAERPDVFVGVDAPDFNLGLEARLKDAGIKTVHFVSPSIWAWRRGRIDKIHRSVDHMLCLFPFEPELYHAKGIAATYVGHPLADAIPMVPPKLAARAQLGLAPDATVVAVLPGSRRSEIKYNAPSFFQAVALLSRQRPELRFVLPVVPGLEDMVEPLLAQHCPDAPVLQLKGQSHAALAAADVTLIASGTATLEAALFKSPMVIAYNQHWLSWQIMKRMGYQPWVGLPNIMAREFLVPERLQDAASPEQLAKDVLNWLDHPAQMDAVRQRFVQIHEQLRCDTARRATDAIAQVLESR
jgi:lipid-A-disaccharide synthase